MRAKDKPVKVLVQCYERGGRYYADEIRLYNDKGYMNSKLRGSPLGRSSESCDDAFWDFKRRVYVENPDLVVEVHPGHTRTNP